MPNDNEEKTFTQAEVDAIVKERLDRERNKHADYEELRNKAKAYDEAQEASATELQKLQKRAETAESKLTAYEAKEKHAALVKKVMDEKKVDAKYADLLTATDEDELAKQAELLAERFAEPVPSDSGKQPNVDSSDKAKFAHELFSGKTNN